jgi:hypothetical protein
MITLMRLAWRIELVLAENGIYMDFLATMLLVQSTKHGSIQRILYLTSSIKPCI